MSKQLSAMTRSIALMAALGFTSMACAQDKPFGDPDSVAYSQDLWAALEEASLAGDGAINTVPYTGQHPHGAVLETLYSEVTVNGHAGEVIVKRNYGGEGITNAKVANNRGKYLKAVTVMFKREAGYDPDNNDWFWVKYKPDGSLHTNPKDMKLAGRVAKGMNAGCIACHSGMRANDFQFNITEAINE